MKLARIGANGSEVPAVLDDEGVWRDLSGVIGDTDATRLGAALIEQVRDALAGGGLPAVADVQRFGPPLKRDRQDRLHRPELPRPRRRDRAAGPGRAGAVHEGPGHGRGARRRGPRARGAATKTDWEVELAVVIGRPRRRTSTARTQAAEHIAGYAISHDVSEREFQIERGGQWDKGKNCDDVQPVRSVAGHGRRGARPAVARPAAVGQRRAPAGRLDRGHGLRGATTSSATCQPVHDAVPRRRHQHRHAGGCRPGRARHALPQAGDVVELEIDGLGRQRQTFGAA